MHGANSTLHSGCLAKVRALAFDLDGTLVDSSSGITASLRVAFEAIGRKLPARPLCSAVGPPINLMARRIEPTLTDLEVAAIERGFRSDYDANGWRATVAFDGVSASLRRMRDAGLRLFIVTNKPRISTQGILEHLELDNVFESVLTRDARTPIYESKVAMLADLIRNQGLEAATSAMVGDTDEDREAAHRNGLPFVFVTYGYGSVPDAELVADNFETIESMLGLESEKQ